MKRGEVSRVSGRPAYFVRTRPGLSTIAAGPGVGNVVRGTVAPNTGPAILAGHQTHLAMNDTYSATAPAPVRPTLLTVICILSFLFGAYSLVTGVIGSFHETTDEDRALVEQKMAEAQQQAPGMEAMMDSMTTGLNNTLEHSKQINMGGALAAIISLFGVWMMWNLRKTGFWLYLIGVIIGLVVPLYYIGGNIVGFGYVGFFGFISLIFVILYAVNLKYMR